MLAGMVNDFFFVEYQDVKVSDESVIISVVNYKQDRQNERDKDMELVSPNIARIKDTAFSIVIIIFGGTYISFTKTFICAQLNST